MPIGASCLLHAGLITALVVGQQWVIIAVAVPPPVLPVQLVTLDAAEAHRAAPPVPPPRERARPVRQPEPPRPQRAPAAAKADKLDEPTPHPPAPAPVAPVEPTPPAVATLPAISEPEPAPASPPPVASSPPLSLPSPLTVPSPSPLTLPSPQTGEGGSAVASKPPSVAPQGITRTARPQGGYQVRPAYPSAPRRLGVQGTTMLRVHVLADGRIGDVLVERSAGHPDLDEAAMQAVRRWRFEPARRGVDAVAMWVLLPVEFRLTR